MFKLYLVLFATACSAIPSLNHAKCCYQEKLLFQKSNKNISCTNFGGSIAATTNNGLLTPLKLSEYEFSVKYGHCEIFVCQNGKPPAQGTYCGKGPCNIFGCNCDYGCVTGDPATRFQALHGDQVYNVRQRNVRGNYATSSS